MRARCAFALVGIALFSVFISVPVALADPGDRSRHHDDQYRRHHDDHYRRYDDNRDDRRGGDRRHGWRHGDGGDYYKPKKHGWVGYYAPPQPVYVYRSPRPAWAWDSYEYTPPPPYGLVYERCRWKRGGYVPGHVAVMPVYGWQEMYLAPPPPGAYYGYVDNDLLLISQATSQILDVLVNHRR